MGSPDTSRATKVEPFQAPAPKDSPETSDSQVLAEVLHDALDNAPFKWELIAHELDVDSSLLSHWTSHRGPMPAFRLIALTRCIGPGVLRWIARQCGFDLVPYNAKARREPGS